MENVVIHVDIIAWTQFSCADTLSYSPWPMGTAQQHNVLDIYLTEISVTCKKENFLTPGSYLEISDVVMSLYIMSVLFWHIGPAWMMKTFGIPFQSKILNPLLFPSVETRESPSSAFSFISCQNQSDLYLRAHDQSCLSNDTCVYILDRDSK